MRDIAWGIAMAISLNKSNFVDFTIPAIYNKKEGVAAGRRSYGTEKRHL